MENSNHLCSVVCACRRREIWDFKLPVDVIVCVSLAVSYVRVNLPEFPRYFYRLIFQRVQMSCLLIFQLILCSIFGDKSFSQMSWGSEICNTTAILEVSGKLNLLIKLNRVPLIVLGFLIFIFPLILQGVSKGVSRGSVDRGSVFCQNPYVCGVKLG